MNFIGKSINGYFTPRIMLTEKATLALKHAQDILWNMGYHIIVYDGYRPMRATKEFCEWGENIDDIQMMKYFYPFIEKDKLFDGYISRKSAHTRGSTVDISIIEKGKELKEIPDYIERNLLGSTSRKVFFLNDNSIDMYTSVDLLDQASWHDSILIPNEYNDKRTFLKNIMIECGFNPYEKEWWHYSLKDEPYPETYFDYVEDKLS